MTKGLIRIAFTVSSILAGASEVFACSCGDPGVREKFRAADSVFVGRVVEMTPVSPSAEFPVAAGEVRLRVEKRWKGSKKSEITAIANFDMPGFCGDLNLAVGERYLIYAEREKGRLVIHTDCGPNRNLKYAAEEVKRLNGFWFRFAARLYPYPVL